MNLRYDYCGNDFLEDVPGYLDEVSKHERDGEVVFTGYKGNYKVTVKAESVLVVGSAAKFLRGNNYIPLNRRELGQAIDKLSSELHQPFDRSKAYRLDIAQNLIMEHKPEAYFNLLSDSRYLKKVIHEHSVYFNNKCKGLIFYSKNEESKRDIIPMPYKSQNVLRVENRYLRQVHKSLNLTHVPVSELRNNVGLNKKLITNFHNDYKSIRKVKNGIHYPLGLQSPATIKTYLQLKGIEAIGGLAETLIWAKNQEYRNKQYKYRTLNFIKSVDKMENLTYDSDLLAELNRKIDEAIELMYQSVT